MATMYKCDRCGDTRKVDRSIYGEWGELGEPSTYVGGVIWAATHRNLDICPRCQRELLSKIREWWNGR